MMAVIQVRELKSVLLLLSLVAPSIAVRYTPDWASIDSRPLPQWFDDAKVGIFIHWGVFSVPGFGKGRESAFLWMDWINGDPLTLDFLKKNYPPDITYADFASSFHAEFYDPNEWADIFKASGARYIVITSKHHEGFTNWPSKVSWNWNSMDVGPKRDLIGDLASAIRNRTNIHFGLYHSLFEFANPLWLRDKAGGFKTRNFVTAKAMPELYEIVSAYKPDVVWSDGDWDALDTYWNSTGFLAWLYNDSPVKDTVVTNDRWGSGIACHHGGYYTCTDKYNPKVLQKHKWENCMTIDLQSWGYRRDMAYPEVIDIHTLIQTMIETVSCGGNLLMNVGPTSDGRISPLFEERLRQFGDWMSVNGEAIYESRPWTSQNDTVTSDVWYTSKKDAAAGGLSVYAIMLSWPKSNILVLGAVKPSSDLTVSMLGYSGHVSWTSRPEGGISVLLPLLSDPEMPCRWAWTFKLTGLSQSYRPLLFDPLK